MSALETAFLTRKRPVGGSWRLDEASSTPPPKTPPKPRVVTTSASKVVALRRQEEAKHPALAGAADDWSEF